MICFSFFTYKAQINAMPCLPDRFEIEVSATYQVNEGLSIRYPIFEGYEHRYRTCNYSKSIFLMYERIETPRNKWTVQDAILNSFHYESPK